LLRGKRTQLDFSELLGLSKNTYSRYERGARIPDADFLKTVCLKLQVNPGWLLFGEGEQYDPKIDPQLGGDVSFPPKEGGLDFARMAFTLFMMYKTPDSLRSLPDDRQKLISTFLWNMVQSMTGQELTIILAIIQAWLDEWRADQL